MTGFNKDDKGQWIEKGPNATLDYSVDWTEWLQPGETIVTSTWYVPIGVTKSFEENTTAIATVWVSNGVIGREYAITNRIVTSDGRQDERSFRIRVIKR